MNGPRKQRVSPAKCLLALVVSWAAVVMAAVAMDRAVPADTTAAASAAASAVWRDLPDVARQQSVDAAWHRPADLSQCAARPIVRAADDTLCDVAGFGANEFYSQGREDIALASRYFCGKRGGSYVEIGAVDGLKCSNSLWFDRTLGWRGLLVEAQPDSAAALLINRGARNTVVAEAVCATAGGFVEFWGGAGDLRAGSVETMRETTKGWYERRLAHAAKEGNASKFSRKVPCRPFGDMLRRAGFSRSKPVDFASVDVEGAEHAIIETMDFEIPVRVWLIEMDGENTRPGRAGLAPEPPTAKQVENAARVRAQLLAHGYRESTWLPSAFCSPLPGFTSGPLSLRKSGGMCPNNALFEHPDLVLSASEAMDPKAPQCCGCET